MIILSAYEAVDGIQVNRLVDNQTIDAQLIFPEDPQWDAAVMAASTLSASDGSIYLKDGEPITYGAQPSDRHRYDYAAQEWVDPWTLSAWQEDLAARRSAASMPRLNFVLSCLNFGILDQPEALIAVEGGFPQAFQAILDTMPPEEQFEAQLRWKGATEIDRTNSLIVNMAAAIHLDEWTLDQVFGVTWPPPLASWPPGQLHP